MDKRTILKKIEKIYTEKNVNISKYLRTEFNEEKADISDILISYDFQAGTYIKDFYQTKEFMLDFLKRLSEILDSLGKETKSILECGTGEGTVIVPLLKMINHKFDMAGAIDISWSRIRYALDFSRNYDKENKIEFAVGDMFCLPCANNSYDIVFTSQAIEPNRGKEKEILSELYRVTNKYLILIEPAYELVEEEYKKRMDEHGYVQHLYSSAKELGYNISKWELYGKNRNELNPVGLMIIEKENNNSAYGGWSCPITKSNLSRYSDVYYSTDSLLAYPIVGGVPMLTEENAIVATKFLDFHK